MSGTVHNLAAVMRSFHLTVSAVGRHVWFPTKHARRAAVRALGRVAGAWITLVALVDDHVHVVVFCEEERAGRLARAPPRVAAGGGVGVEAASASMRITASSNTAP